jgi:flagellar hook-associated protein 2
MEGTSTAASHGSLAVKNAADVLTGTISIQVGDGSAQTVSLGSSGGTLQDLADAINNAAGIGVTAALNVSAVGMNGPGTILTLTSNTSGAAGTLTVISQIFDTAQTSSRDVGYVNSSDISGISSLGISMNNDGTLVFDASRLDALLNTDFGGIAGMFQSVNSWGTRFAAMLNSAGTTSSTGVLKLALNSNRNTESSINANISRQESLISAQQKRLTAQLTTANEILQRLPSQLDGISQLYSAITGYNQNR